MEIWDRLDNISLFLKTKSKIDSEQEFLSHGETFSKGFNNKRRVRITLRDPNDGKQFVMERIIRRQIEEREKHRRDVSPVKNKVSKRSSRQNKKERIHRRSNQKRSLSPKRKIKRRKFKTLPQEEPELGSSTLSQQSSSSRSKSSSPAGQLSRDKVSVDTVFRSSATNKIDQWYQLDLQQNPLYRNDINEERMTEQDYSTADKGVKYVRISALSPRCFARENLLHTHGLYEVDGHFSRELRTSRLPSVNGSENGEKYEKKEKTETRSPPPIKPEVVHYTDGCRVGSIEVFEPIYILNSLCQTPRQQRAVTPRSQVSSVDLRPGRGTPQRRLSVVSHSSRKDLS